MRICTIALVILQFAFLDVRGQQFSGDPVTEIAGDALRSAAGRNLEGEGAYHFNGVDQYLTFSPYNPGTGDFTIEGWVKMDSYGYGKSIFDEEQDGATGRPNLKVIIHDDGRLQLHTARAGYSGSDDQYLYSNSIVPLGDWTYFACTREGGVYKIYINGQLDAEVNHGVNYDIDGITSSGFIGRRYNSSYSGSQYYLHGSVDEIRVSSVARTETEISDHYSGLSEFIADGNTVILWHMNGSTGTPEKQDNAQGNGAFDLTEFNAPPAVCGFNECMPSDQWPTFAHDFGRTSRSGITLGDISGLTREWSYDTGILSQIYFASPVIANDIVYISYESGLHALDLQTGQLIWMIVSSPNINRSTPTVDVENNRIYFSWGDVPNTFFCADASTGDIIWHRDMDLPGDTGYIRFAHSVIIGDDIFFGDDIGQIYCLDKNTGADKYYTQLDGNIYTSPSYGLVDTGGASIDMLFWSTYPIALLSGSIYGMEPTASGFNEIWHYENPNIWLRTHFYACPTFYEGLLLAHAYAMFSENDGYSGYRISLNPADGSEIHSDYRIGTALYAPPAVLNGVAYYAAYYNYNAAISGGTGITAVDIASNSILWNYDGDGSTIDRIPVHASLSSDPYLFYGTYGGEWKILDGNTGELEIQYRLGKDSITVYGTALAHGSDGKDYIVVSARLIPGTPHGAVYAFTIDNIIPRPRLHVPHTLLRSSDSLTPPVHRTFTDVFTNTGTEVLSYTATLAEGAAMAKKPADKMSLLDRKTARFKSNANMIDDPEKTFTSPSNGRNPQKNPSYTPPGWVSWVDPYSSNESVSGYVSPGESVSFTFELDLDSLVHLENLFRVHISTNDPDYKPWLPWFTDQGIQETIEFIDARAKYDSIETACTKLRVGRNGDYGDKGEAPGYAMDYSLTGDCDPEADVYIFSGSPVICYQNEVPEIIASHSLWTEERVYPVFDKNPAESTVTTSAFDRYESGTFVTLDSALAVENTWWAPKAADSCAFVIKRLRLYSNDGLHHTGLRIGEAVDWDIPSDTDTRYGNTGGYSEARKLIYQRGRETYAAGCQPNDSRFGGMALLGFYVNNCETIDTTATPYGAYVADNVVYVYPNSGFVATELDSLMQIPGYNLTATETDLHSVMTFLNDYSLAAEDTLNIFIALISVQNGTEATLLENADKAAQWLNDHIISVCNSSVICGDANGDLQVNVGDAVFLISYVFKGGPAPDPLCAGDANGDSDINVGDAVYLISYVFKGGPAPVEGCCQ